MSPVQSTQTPSSDSGSEHSVVDASAPHEDADIDITWCNLYAHSDFTLFRKRSSGPIERILKDFARVLETGLIEKVMSVNASERAFYVTVVCTKNFDEIKDQVIFQVL